MPTYPSPQFFIVGGAHIDRIARSHARLEPGQSNPGIMHQGIGGVGGNIACNLAKLDWEVALSTILGSDTDSLLVRSELEKAAIDTTHVMTSENKTTANYTAIEDRNGALIAAIADMAIYDAYPSEKLETILNQLPEKTPILADTNLPQEALDNLVRIKGLGT